MVHCCQVFSLTVPTVDIQRWCLLPVTFALSSMAWFQPEAQIANFAFTGSSVCIAVIEALAKTRKKLSPVWYSEYVPTPPVLSGRRSTRSVLGAGSRRPHLPPNRQSFHWIRRVPRHSCRRSIRSDCPQDVNGSFKSSGDQIWRACRGKTTFARVTSNISETK